MEKPMTPTPKHSSYITVPHRIMQSPEWSALSPRAMKLLFQIAAQYRGANNGALSATVDGFAAAAPEWKKGRKLQTALRELEEARWVLRTKEGAKGAPALYAVTWWPVDHFHDGKPAEKRASDAWSRPPYVIDECQILSFGMTAKDDPDSYCKGFKHGLRHKSPLDADWRDESYNRGYRAGNAARVDSDLLVIDDSTDERVIAGFESGNDGAAFNPDADESFLFGWQCGRISAHIYGRAPL